MTPRTLHLVTAALLAACSSSSQSAVAPASPRVSATESPVVQAPASPKSALEGAALVLDVRTPQEHAEGHLANDTLIPVQELEARVGEVEAAVKGDKTAKVVTYCHAGRRAEQAKQILVAHGFSNVVNGGGYEQLR